MVFILNQSAKRNFHQSFTCIFFSFSYQTPQKIRNLFVTWLKTGYVRLVSDGVCRKDGVPSVSSINRIVRNRSLMRCYAEGGEMSDTSSSEPDLKPEPHLYSPGSQYSSYSPTTYSPGILATLLLDVSKIFYNQSCLLKILLILIISMKRMLYLGPVNSYSPNLSFSPTSTSPHPQHSSPNPGLTSVSSPQHPPVSAEQGSYNPPSIFRFPHFFSII